MSKKILFITAYFYPANTIAVVRNGEWIKYLALQGYEITVLTTKKYNFIYGDLTNDIKLTKNVKIIEVDFLPKFLFKNKNKKKSITTKKSKIDLIKKVIRKIRYNFIGSLFDIYDLWVKKGTKKGIEILEKDKFDYMISSFSPPATHKIAHTLKKKYPNIKWIADFRDLWVDNAIIQSKGIFHFIEEKIEQKVLSNVDSIITVSEAFTNILKNKYPNKKIYTIENGFDSFFNWKENIFSKKNNEIKDKLIITFFGSIYLNKQDPSLLFNVIQEMIDKKLINENEIEICFYGNNERELNSIIGNKKYNFIKIFGMISRESSLEKQKECDLLLFLEWNDKIDKGILPGKIFEYMISGTPVLGIGINKEYTSGKLIKDCGIGKIFIDKKELYNDILKILKTKKIDFFNPNIDIINKYSKKEQIKKLVQIIENLN